MNDNHTIESNFLEHLQTIKLLRNLHAETIKEIGKVLVKSINNGGTLYLCGNGGSAADSQHLAAEMVGRFKNNRRAIRSVSLTTDTSVLTCIANDFDYEYIFARQLEALGRTTDILIGISTSGNSENIIYALNTAKEIGMTTIALLGKNGGSAKNIADHSLVIPSDSTARIQEAHILIGHILCELIEEELGFE